MKYKETFTRKEANDLVCYGIGFGLVAGLTIAAVSNGAFVAIPYSIISMLAIVVLINRAFTE